MSTISTDGDLHSIVSNGGSKMNKTDRENNSLSVDYDELADVASQSLEDILNEDSSTPSEVDALVAELTSAFTHRDLDVADDTTSMGGASSLADTAAAGANGTSTFFLHARGLSKSPTVSSLTSTPIYEGLASAAELVPIEVISAQLSTAHDRMNSGQCTCIALNRPQRASGAGSELYIGIGTSQGCVLVFDGRPPYTLKCSLNMSLSARPYGACSALSFSPNGVKLVVGFAKGHVQLIDVRRGKVLAALTPDRAHQDGHGVLQVEYLHTSNTVVCVDSGGSVFVLKFGATLAGGVTVKTSCVFSGCHGEVCTVVSLHPPTSPTPKEQTTNVNIYHRRQLLAMASMTKCIVVALHPQPAVVFATALTGRADSVPLVAWQWMPVQLARGVRVFDPVIAMCRGSVVHLHQVHSTGTNEWRSYELMSIHVDGEPMNMCWMNDRCLCVLTADERLQLYEVSTNGARKLEAIDIAAIRLVYATASYKGLATGGNVSGALQCLAERATYHSMVNAVDGNVYLLGTHSVYAVCLRSWQQRIDALLAAREHTAALTLATHLYTGRTGRLGVAGNGGRHELVERVLGVCEQLIDRAMSTDLPKSLVYDTLIEHYKRVVPAVVETLVAFKRTSVLYGTIYDKVLRSRAATAVYLESLEQPIIDNHLPDVPAPLIQQFLQHLCDESQFAAFEACIVHIPIERLDLHQAITICRTHALYDGIIYVHTRALIDYLTPLKEMYIALRTAVERDGDVLSDVHVQLGNKILLYISCCLTGQAYPTGELDLDTANIVVRDVAHALLTPHDPTLDGVGADTSTQPQLSTPYLRTLFQFDTREFLNVLSLAFAHPLFINCDWGKHVAETFVDTLITLVIELTPHDGARPAHTVDLGAFITFMARIISDGRLTVRLDVFSQIVCSSVSHCAYSTTPGSYSHDEREQAVLGLMRTPRVASQIDVDALLASAHAAHFYQLCEHIYRQREDYPNVMECYLLDSQRQTQVFACVRSLLDAYPLSRANVESHVFTVVHRLFTIDSIATVQMLTEACTPSRLPELLPHMHTFPFDRIRLLLDIEQLHKSVVLVRGDYRLFDALVTALAEHARSPVRDDDGITGERHLLRLLNASDDTLLDARYELLTTLAVAHELIAVRVLLLEHRNLREQAQMLLHDKLQECIQACNAADVDVNCGDRLLNVAREYISFCARGAHTGDTATMYWTNLFDALLTLPNAYISTNADVRDLLSSVVHALVARSAPHDVLARLLNHESFKSCTYAEHRQLIGSIVQVFDYERILLDSLVACMRSEAAITLSSCVDRRRAAAALPTGGAPVCVRCHTRVVDKCAVFPACGHACHVTCMGRRESTALQCTQCRVPPHLSPQTPLSPRTRASKAMRESTPAYDEAVPERGHVVNSAARNPFDSPTSSTVIRTSKNPFEDDDNASTQSTTSLFDENRFPLQLAPPQP